MRAETALNDGLPIHVPEFIPTWDRHVARFISAFANPIILACAMVLITARAEGGLAAWNWAFFGIVTSIGIPVCFILVLLKLGKLSDFDIYHREQRMAPYLVSLASGAITVITMVAGGAPTVFTAISAAACMLTVTMFLINMHWKISAHAAGTAGFIVVLVFLAGAVALPAVLGIPLMIWSRVRLRRHTLMQTLAGSALGLLVFSGVLALFTG